MKEEKLCVKLHLRYPLHAKLYLAYSNDKRIPVIGFIGSSNLTMAGLSGQGELNIDVLEQDAAEKMAKWFSDRWIDKWCVDITKELIEIIDNSWATERLISPYHIYIKMAYHLSREAIAGIAEYKIPPMFSKELLDFQEKAVAIAAHHINKRGGVIIGDVVGLGKTITACAVAKMFEETDFTSTLIICPPNLIPMWNSYIEKYDMKAMVISIGEVQQKLPGLRRFRFTIIDESHNLRNDQGSRYRAIKEYLRENESKIMLLSATPYNKSYLDLANQLKLFVYEDKDLGICPEQYIRHIGGEVQFMAKHSDTFIRSIKAFEKSHFPEDWHELMRFYLLRRTRGFIKNNYSKKDESGRRYLSFSDGTHSFFPDRIPKKVEYPFNEKDSSDQYAKLYSPKIVDILNSLNLPRYGLAKYIDEKPLEKPDKSEEVILGNLSRAGKRLMGFCRTNLFKRLESSGYSFILSLGRHAIRNFVFIYALENKLPLPIGKNIADNLDDYLEDSDTEDNDNLLKIILLEEQYLSEAAKIYKDFATTHRNRYQWIKSSFFKHELKKSLIDDGRKVIEILNTCKNWNSKTDRKLNALYNLLANTHQDEKVLVFTQFSDTAEYLAAELKNKFMLKIEAVTGDTKDPTELAHRFSPISNKKADIVTSNQEIRVLISTDVLSEGQNLQDAHIVVNYDLPWAIIRLIQRAGRVDRIGQKSDKIFCYSFLPEDGIEKIIHLRKTLTERISQNADVVGSDETFFDGDTVKIHDLYSEKSGILDEDDDTEVDLASYAYQIWKDAIETDPLLQKIIPDLPNVIYSTKKNESDPEKEGTIVYTRTAGENDVLAWINTAEKIITQSQLTILKAVECTAKTKPEYKLDKHHELVKIGVDFIKKEEKSSLGVLGRKTGVKYRTYMRLDRFCKEYENSIFMTENLKKAIDEIYRFPLKEYAKDIINRQMKAGISDIQLTDLVTSLRDEDRLCIQKS